ncbi:MAG: carotenoid 1,2-hydratase [Pseudomonadota bacterium]
MTERGSAHGERTATRFSLGPSDLEWRDGRLVLNFDERAMPWPRQNMLPERIRGKLTLDAGAITRRAFTIDAEDRHGWWPISPSSRIKAEFDGGKIPDWEGHGYLDSNWGEAGLEDAFIDWDWARGELPSGDTVILYDTRRRDGSEKCLCLRYAEDGSVSEFELPQRHSLGRGFWGVLRASHADNGHAPRLVRSLEDGPFYCRSEIFTRLLGEDITLMHESFSGKRFANPLVKAMLLFRMPRRR